MKDSYCFLMVSFDFQLIWIDCRQVFTSSFFPMAKALYMFDSCDQWNQSGSSLNVKFLFKQ